MQANNLKYALVKNVAQEHGFKKGVSIAMNKKIFEKPRSNIHARKCFRIYYPDENIE